MLPAKRDWPTNFTFVFFLLLTIWWLWLESIGVRETFHNYLFGATYGLMALWGGLWGIKIAKKWGGLKSLMGSSIWFLSLGLLAQEFGQIVFSYYNIVLGVTIPYPSIADLGFFGNIPLYIIGIILLARASGIQFSLRKLSGQFQILILPLILLGFSYWFFLRNYTFNWQTPVTIFLDLGYPLGQALYISLALATYLLTKALLGGIMKNKVLFIIGAFLAQYLSDYNFLFQTSRGTWYNGGYGDYLYLIAYFIMTLGLLQLNNIHSDLKIQRF